MIYKNLNPEKALIWRIIHRDNFAWVLEHGLHAGNSPVKAKNWVHIGSPELTEKRASKPVTIGKGGMLNDYVPFYFTPFSPMLLNIRSGRGGTTKRANEEILILVSSMHKIAELGLSFAFTDAHAYYSWSNFYNNLNDLKHIDWDIIQRRDFKRDNDDLHKFERYQAEALVYMHCPLEALVGVVCYSEATEKHIQQLLEEQDVRLQTTVRPNWYFS